MFGSRTPGTYREDLATAVEEPTTYEDLFCHFQSGATGLLQRFSSQLTCMVLLESEFRGLLLPKGSTREGFIPEEADPQFMPRSKQPLSVSDLLHQAHHARERV